MRIQRLLCVSLAWLGASSVPAGDAPAFHPEAGTRVKKTFEHRFALDLEEVRLIVGEEEHPLPEPPEATLVNTERIVVEDVYVELADGQPAKLRRTFSELAGKETQSQGENESESEKDSDLEGLTVVFTLDAESGEYAVELDAEDAEEGSTDLLAHLTEDMDLRGFLPDGEVEVGDTWEVPLSAWKSVVSPGGEVGLTDEENREFSRAMHDAWQSELEAEYTGRREVDGRSFGVISVTGKASSEAGEDVDVEESTVHREAEISVDLEIELLWDLDRGHLHGLALTGEVELLQRESRSMEAPDGSSVDFTQELEFSGEVKLDVSIER